MTNETTNGSKKVMYLSRDYWSPRYEADFYTVKLEGVELLSSPPSADAPDKVGGKHNFPSYYYTVVVYRSHDKKILQRRFSQFKWMYDRAMASPPTDVQPPSATPIRMPPGTCPFQWQDDAFAQNRLEQLSEFVADLLGRPGYANHPAVRAFLEL